MPKPDYFLRRRNEEHGPMTSARIRELAAAGNLSHDDAIRRGDNGEWFGAADIPGLFDNTSGPTDVGELIEDPFVNLAKHAARTIRKTVRTVAKAAAQLANAAKRAIARPPRKTGVPMTTINCQSCNAPINIPASKIGHNITCPGCKMLTATIPTPISPMLLHTPTNKSLPQVRPIHPSNNVDEKILEQLMNINKSIGQIHSKVRDFHIILILWMLLIFGSAVLYFMNVAAKY